MQLSAPKEENQVLHATPLSVTSRHYRPPPHPPLDCSLVSRVRLGSGSGLPCRCSTLTPTHPFVFRVWGRSGLDSGRPERDVVDEPLCYCTSVYM